jgi:hypothetical protein
MRVILIIGLCLVSYSSQLSQSQVQQKSPAGEQRKEFELIIPKETWEPIFFRAIDERAGIAKLPSLRDLRLPKDDLETRIWIGFGLSALRGFDLKRSTGQWTGVYIQGIRPRLSRGDYQKALAAPESGWPALWQKLTDKGILTLPDARAIACEGGALDGVSYVVENNIDNTYRTYMYENPQFATCREAKQIIEIVEILHDQFGPQLPR